MTGLSTPELGVNLCGFRPKNGVGVENFVRNIVSKMPVFSRSIVAIPRGLKIESIYAEKDLPGQRPDKVIHTPNLPTPLRVIFEMLALSVYFFSCQKVFSTNNFGPLFGRSGQERIIMIMDVWFLSDHYEGSRVNRMLYGVLIKLQVKFSHKVITISEFSKNEINKHLGIKKSDIDVISLCTAKTDSQGKNTDAVKTPYFLLIGSDRKNKNVERAIKAYVKYVALQSAPIHLKVVGPYSEEFKSSMLDRLSNQSLVDWIGYTERDNLNALIENCRAVYFPSIYEGYGIPVIEALNARKPILLAKNSSCEEIAGNACIAVDCSNVDALVDGLQRLENFDSTSFEKEYDKFDEMIHDCEGCAKKLQQFIFSTPT